LRIGPSAHQSLRGLLPGLSGTSSLYLAVGIIGATVMPHAIYLHSALTNGRMPVRDEGERRRVLRFERVDVIVALGFAGIVIPAIAVLAAGINPTSALVLSQVVLSFGIPLALVPLVMLTSRRDVMGVHVNRRLTSVLAWGCALLITLLNVFLIYQQLFIS